jgi:hypothetical protein
MFWGALRADHLDLAFKAGGGYDVRVVERPGLWMDPGALDALIADCQAVAATSLPAPLDYGIFEPGSGARERTIVTLVRDRDSGRPIAFNALPLVPVELGGGSSDLLHLGLVMVDPAHRGGGLSWILYGLTCFLLYVRRQFRPLWISSVTQVPAVVGLVAETFDSVWPGADSAPTFAHRHIARQLMRDHRHVFGVGQEAGYDETRGIITDAYTGGSDNLKKSYAVAAKHRHSAYNEYCERELDYGRGDDVLQIGQVNMATAQRFLVRSVPRRALPRLAVQFLLLGVQALVAPTLQWLTADRPLGSLRAAK